MRLNNNNNVGLEGRMRLNNNNNKLEGRMRLNNNNNRGLEREMRLNITITEV